jgi:hypothetical protein
MHARDRAVRRAAGSGQRHTLQHRLLPGRRVHRWARKRFAAISRRDELAKALGALQLDCTASSPNTRAPQVKHRRRFNCPFVPQTCAWASPAHRLRRANSGAAHACTRPGCATCRRQRPTAHCAARALARAACAQVGRGLHIIPQLRPSSTKDILNTWVHAAHVNAAQLLVGTCSPWQSRAAAPGNP